MLRNHKRLRAIIFVVLGLILCFIPFVRAQERQVAQQPSEEKLKEVLQGRAERAEIKVIEIITSDDQGQKFSFPAYLAYDPEMDELYVIDTGRARVIVYSPDLFPIFSMGKGRGLVSPSGLAIDHKGNLYVCEAGRPPESKPHIAVFNGAAIKTREIYFSGFKGAEEFIPRSIAIGKNGNLYVAGLNYPGAIVLSPEGKYLRTISPKDSFIPNEKPRSALIIDVYVDSSGRLYLLSEEMGRFYVYDENGNFLFKGGQKGGGPGKLSRPRGICADPNQGLIYVVDYLRHSGLAYDYDTGKLMFEFGGRGWTPGWFNYPSDIIVDKFGRIYIADLFNHRVQVVELWQEKEGLPFGKIPSFLPQK
ncbi:NHL repeat-containing protein [Thermodesulfatator atlanticus]|uniref:NHL repeat-containing protein n=1 Tax=Thermodesulfatator atlanticus TaxID=501497 RepID=UPI0003B375D6|nr:NHL repeat-containing protein [Thermodesulfatator atlanticus]